jgi:hypothetical protein
MKKKLIFVEMAAIILSILLALFCQPGLAGEEPIVRTDKEIYSEGDTIKVHFSNSPGDDSDWICIVPARAPDTDIGDYKYLPQGLRQGILTFDPPSPGRYEVRAYYNYKIGVYKVSGRQAFSVVRSPQSEEAYRKLMERKIDPRDPLEANLPAETGLVYIFREATFASSSYSVLIDVDGKSVVAMNNSSYLIYPAPAGPVRFKTLGVRGIQESQMREPFSNDEADITVRAGHVHYLKLEMIAVPGWRLLIDPVPHEEGARAISTNKLTLIRK